MEERYGCFFLLLAISLTASLIKADNNTKYGVCRTCYDGYTGEQCTQSLCYGSTTCENGGNCTAPNNCVCLNGYVGNRCEQAVCFGSVTCENGGTCISPNKCSCMSGFTGEKCETKSESDHGTRNVNDIWTLAVVFMLSRVCSALQ